MLMDRVRGLEEHAYIAAFPYLDVTKISIREPCLNFAVYSSHMLPRRLRRLDVLLVWYIKGKRLERFLDCTST